MTLYNRSTSICKIIDQSNRQFKKGVVRHFKGMYYRIHAIGNLRRPATNLEKYDTLVQYTEDGTVKFLISSEDMSKDTPIDIVCLTSCDPETYDTTYVIYEALYGGHKLYARPIDMFLSVVDTTKYPNAGQVHRLEYVKNENELKMVRPSIYDNTTELISSDELHYLASWIINYLDDNSKSLEDNDILNEIFTKFNINIHSIYNAVSRIDPDSLY